MVEATIDLVALEDHQFVIKPDFDDNLKIYRKRMDDLRDEMVAEHIRVGNDLRQDTEKKLKLEQQHVYGWCLRLTRNVISLTELMLIVGSWFYSREEGIYCKPLFGCLRLMCRNYLLKRLVCILLLLHFIR